MESLKIFEIKNPGSKKTTYKSSFSKPGSILKLVEYFKTTNTPDNSEIVCISVNVKKENEIERIMTCPLPNDNIVTAAIGSQPVYVKYEIAYDDQNLVSKAVHPPMLDKLFKFVEVLSVSEEDGILTFTREATVFNIGKQIPIIGSSYQIYDDFYNRSNMSYYWGISEECI